MNVTYAPCLCDYFDQWSIDGYFVSCLAVQSAALIQEAFNKTEIIEHNSFYVTMDHFSALPANFLTNKKVQNLNFKCPNTSFTLGPVDLDASKGQETLLNTFPSKAATWTAWTLTFWRDSLPSSSWSSWNRVSFNYSWCRICPVSLSCGSTIASKWPVGINRPKHQTCRRCSSLAPTFWTTLPRSS